MRLLRRTREHNGAQLYEQNCTSIQISGFYSWFICFCSINHFHTPYLHLVCFHFVPFTPEMIYGESTLSAVHFTLSLQYAFTELCGNVCITENDIYWGTGVQHGLKQNIAPPPTQPFVQWITFFYVHKTCASVETNCIICCQLQLIFTVIFSIDSWHKGLRANLCWLRGG